ncbi:hypothetical protein K493DRAFT_319531 [Basidiobolus meristosporus CBS 931.73]|uniref:HMG box domain-containing protein n=1 Tax=Basidiobolus meristosporus CBS 931.73 TaxID=1314790 RepID=A0A1Y1XSS1_9FUNG|nr:hypothetical protein K493DRAFT_319531 [Basidiobolus meristosporus CBS 931.73]|eukprot:ORX88354.1 hypothetical protein K493DRAFT_319531 [Basidiobolus meristosporus CBS 931.73]
MSSATSDSPEKKLPNRSSGRIKAKTGGISLMSLEEAYTPRKTRERKNVELHEPGQESPTKKAILYKGPGTPLKDIPRVASKIHSRKGKDYTLYALHRFLFGRTRRKPNVKEDLGRFRGITFQNLEEEDVYWNKLEKWTVETCKDVCDVLDLPFPNNKNDLHNFIMDFLKSPMPREVTDVQEECSIQISPFSYFVREKRGELIKNDPDKSLEDIQKELVALWDSLPNEEKTIYQTQNPNETPTKKRKYTKRVDKKPTTVADQTSPAKRGRKPRNTYDSPVSNQKKRRPKTKEMVDSDEEEQSKTIPAEPVKGGHDEVGKLEDSALEGDEGGASDHK